MADVKIEFKKLVAGALNLFIQQANPELESISADVLAVQTPPNREMGDLGIPMFAFAKTLKMAPPQISAEVVKLITDSSIGEIIAVGPYINLKLNKSNEAFSILEKINTQKAALLYARLSRCI